jgi:ATP phosphoribosyltransferase
MIRLGLPKGRMISDSDRFCRTLGVEIKPGVLSYRGMVGSLEVSIYLLKAQDVARLLAQDLLDLGLTGDEWLMEAGVSPDRRCFEVRSYDATLCLLMAGSDPRPVRSVRSVVTPYPTLARRLLGGAAPDARIMAIDGSSEALVPDIADACMDVVETGDSAALNGLAVRKSFNQVTTHLVRSEKSDPCAVAPIIELLVCTVELAR